MKVESKWAVKMRDKTRIFHYNKTSILIEFDSEINEKLLEFILNFKNKLLENGNEQILQVINTYNSLLIIYKSTINNFYNEKERLLVVISDINVTKKLDMQLKKIPVCYDKDFGLDLELLSDNLQLSISEIISRHTEPIYRVFFIGFLPGFPYLDGLDSSLYYRRKSQPRPQISTGSVGITDKQTGIYPLDSPGGWQIIGRSPIELFNSNQQNDLCYLKPGDKVQFEPISKEEFEYIQYQSNEKSN